MILDGTILFLLLITGFIRLLAFAYEDYAKTDGKKGITTLSNILTGESFFEAQRQYFVRLSFYTKGLSKRKKLKMFLFLTILNIMVLFLSCFVVEIIEHKTFSVGWVALMEYGMYKFSPFTKALSSVAINVLAGLIGASLDYLSVLITVFLIDRISRSKNYFQLLSRILLDIVLVIAMIFIYLAISPWFNWKISNPHWLSYAEARFHTFNASHDWLITLFMSLTSAIPTVVYLALSLAIVIYKLTPSPVRSLIVKLLEALAKEDRNVFEDLAYFTGGIAAILGACKFLL